MPPRLYVLLHRRSARLTRLGLSLMGVGLTLGLIGMVGSALKVLRPNPVAPVINTCEHAGLVFIGLGMIVWGALSLRTSALGRLSAAPMAMGLLGLSGMTFLVPSAFAVLEGGIMPMAFATLWIVLGYAIWSAPLAASAASPKSRSRLAG